MDLLKKFKRFDPLKDNPIEIPNSKGNYIITLKSNCKLPKTKNSFTCKKNGTKDVIYTGISNKSLRGRDYKQHFNGTAGNSTLRKSIGSLFGYKKIPRDKKENGKTKFNEIDEGKLSNWMKHNLELYYFQNLSPEKYETVIIKELNPPLNISKNKNFVNSEFRNELSKLRKVK